MIEFFDISRALANELAPWPGDTPFRFELKWKMSEGASVNVGALSMSAHNGTHADGVYHFQEGGTPIDRMPLDAYVGRAVVVDLTSVFSGGDQREITLDHLAHAADAIAETSRVLLKTGVWRDSTRFPQWLPVIAPGVANWFEERGVKLIGVDVPSVDAIDSKELRNHHALAAAKIAIVESLDLSAIAAGVYRFAALPIKVVGGDGAPVRAVLWREAP